MSWVTILWSMNASACLTLALILLAIWFRQRTIGAELFFFLAAAGTTTFAGCELWMMRADTCLSTKFNRSGNQLLRATKRAFFRGPNSAAPWLGREPHLALGLGKRRRFLRAARLWAQANDFFRQPAANHIDDAGPPPWGMTLVVLIPSAWTQPAATPGYPSQGHRACDRYGNKIRGL
jgi:hypothetical protein